jgi:hypothetical protein
VALLNGCAANASPSGSAAPAGSASAEASAMSAAASPTATASPAASLTPVPGFEDWSFVNRDGAELAGSPAAFRLVLRHRLLWFMASRGFLMYRLVSGNFRVTAHVTATKTSDPSQPAGGSGSVQLGGLMVRNGDDATQNYVHVVVGDDGDGPSIETKTTTNSMSVWAGPAWPTTDADLRICRIGPRLGLYKRLTGGAHWTQAASYLREDFPASVQVGVDLYTNDEPDITIVVEGFTVEPVISQTACTGA